MAARKVSAVAASPGLRRRGRQPGAHRPVLVHLGSLRLKPTLYPEHAELVAALQTPPPGLGRRQYAVMLMCGGLRGTPVVNGGADAPTDDTAGDAFFDV